MSRPRTMVVTKEKAHYDIDEVARLAMELTDAEEEGRSA